MPTCDKCGAEKKELWCEPEFSYCPNCDLVGASCDTYEADIPIRPGMLAVSWGRKRGLNWITKTLLHHCIQNPGTQNRFIVSTPSYGNHVLEKIYEQLQLMNDMEDFVAKIYQTPEKPEKKIRFRNGSTIQVSMNVG